MESVTSVSAYSRSPAMSLFHKETQSHNRKLKHILLLLDICSYNHSFIDYLEVSFSFTFDTCLQSGFYIILSLSIDYFNTYLSA